MTARWLPMLFLVFSSNLLFAQNDSLHKIAWPQNYDPAISKFFVSNSMEIAASPATVWNLLTDALNWSSWYKGAKNVSFENSNYTALDSGAVFNWQTMGLKFKSTIKEYRHGRLLAWESRKKSIRGYHVWLIIPNATGCTVITEESQNGWLTFLEKTFQKNKLRNLHEVWLLELKKRAEQH